MISIMNLPFLNSFARYQPGSYFPSENIALRANGRAVDQVGTPPGLPVARSARATVCRMALGACLTLVFAQVGLANRELQRPELIFDTETRVPKLAGVPPLTGTPSARYKRLSFSGERQLAQGPYVPHHSGGSPSQSRSVLSGEIVYAYNALTDAINITNSVAVYGGTVNVSPWDPDTGPFPAEPVLSVEVPVSYQGGVAVGSNNPFGLTVKDATDAGDNDVFEYYSNEPQTIFFQPGPAIERRDNFQMVLSEPDTPGEAEGRAKIYVATNVLVQENRTTLGGFYTGGNQWTIRKVKVTFRFQCLRPGLYEMVRKYESRILGTGTWSALLPGARETRPVAGGGWNGSFDLPLVSGSEVRLADMTFELKSGGGGDTGNGTGGDSGSDTGDSCTTCSCNSLAGGGPGPYSGSIDWNMPLGLSADGRPAGILSLYSLHVTPELYTPAALTCAVTGTNATIIPDSVGLIRQILAPQALVDIVVTSSNSYDIKVYDRSAAGSPGTDGIYTPSGSPYVIWRVDNPGGTNRWRMSRIIGSDTDVTLVDESVAGVRVFSETNGLRITETTETTEGSDRVEAIVVKDSAGTISSKKKVWYRTFNLGEEMVKEILDPEGLALTTIWTYSTAPNHTYQKLLSIQYPDGFVETMGYSNETGVMLNHTKAMFRNATKYTGSDRTLTDFNADGIIDRLQRDDSGWIFSAGIGLSYIIDWGGVTNIGGVDYTLRESKVAVSVGAAWNTASNITTKERYYAGGSNDGRLAYRLNPDGTLLLARYASGSDGTIISTEEQGTADPTGESVVDGTRTVRVTSARGFLVSSVATDIATTQVIASETVGLADAFGRPTQIGHLDGSVETRSYCQSCGALDHVELHGETVNYEFDGLKRKVRETRSAGSTVLTKTRFEYDADVRLVKTWRVNPADSTEALLSSTTYDLAGRVTAQFDLQSGTTGYSYAFGADNSTITTTTYADGGTRVESRGPSGTVFKVAGTATAPAETLWFPGGGVGSLIRSLRYFSPTEYVTEERGTNYLGQVVYTNYPDGTHSNTYYDAIGRLARTVDQDGVTTLVGYDARGRQAVTAVDLNGNNVIDYTGTDRISHTLYAVGTRNSYAVQRTTTQVLETDGTNTPTDVSVSEQSADGLRSWQTMRGLTSSTVTAFDGIGGRTVTATAPDGTQTVQTYLGSRLQSTVYLHPSLGSLGSVTYAYNDLGQLVSTTDVRTGTTSYSYDASDRLHTATTPDPDASRSGSGYDPQTTTYGYDAMGRTTSVTQPDGGVVNTTYYLHGAVNRTWGSRTYPVEYTYDIQNRVKTLTTWQDFAGDTGKAVTTWNYTNERGFLQNKRYQDGTGPSYTYKPSGRLQTRTWARTPAITCTYSYNTAGDLGGVDYSDATPDVTLAYDRAGRPKTITDASGTRMLAYDASGQLKDEDYRAGLLNTLGVHRTFDSLSRLSGVSALSSQPSTLSSASYSYDAASRLDTVTASTNTATYGYVANSSLVGSVTFEQGGATRLTTTKTYDNLNRLSAISSQPSATSSQLSAAYTYNSANQRTKATREDNAYWDYGYDSLGQVTSGKKRLADNTLINGLDQAWSYDDIGNRKTTVTNGQTSTYTPTLLNQYSARTVPGSVDVFGTASATATVTVTVDRGTPQAVTRQGEFYSKQLTVNNASAAQKPTLKITGVKNNVGPAGEDAVTEVSQSAFVAQTPESFGYDADGNLTDDASWHYSWDGENRLIAMETATAAAAVGVAKQKLEFAYDSQGRRFAKNVFSWSGGAWVLGTSTRFLYDWWNLLAELRLNPPTTTYDLNCSYAWGLDLSGSFQGAGGVGGLVFSTLQLSGSTSASAYASAFDGNGNVIGFVDMATGTKSASYDYSAFGETLIADGPVATLFPVRFSTKYIDSESGLLYYGLRYYNPSKGRWLSRDSAEESVGGANLYAMVSNDPLNKIDPLGLWETDAHHEMVNNLFSIDHSKSFGCCSINLAAAMKDGSDEVDGAGDHKHRFLDAQSEALAYQHAMRAPNESVALARARYERFVAEKIQLAEVEAVFARKNNDCELMRRAFANLGMALHAFSDSLSPSHHGFQVWYGPHAIPSGLYWSGYALYALDHHNQETLSVYHNLQNGVDTAIRTKFGGVIDAMLR